MNNAASTKGMKSRSFSKGGGGRTEGNKHWPRYAKWPAPDRGFTANAGSGKNAVAVHPSCFIKSSADGGASMEGGSNELP
jgi:hypothetical protein